MASKIILLWPANPASEFVSKYQLLESFNGGVFNLKADVVASSEVPPSFEILSPSPGSYRWQVRAVNFVGTGPVGNIASGPTVPTTPGDITVTVVNS
jgi:hypothetical protein